MFWRISWSLERYIRKQLPQHLSPLQILEFGPGRSTRVLAETFPAAHITSVEHHESYYQKQKCQLGDLQQVQLHHCPLDEGRFYTRGEWAQRAYDLILVDGPPKRTTPQARGGADCVFPNLSEGGLVILDDSHRKDERAILQRWIQDHGFSKVYSGFTFTALKKQSCGTR